MCTAYIAVFGDTVEKIYEKAGGDDYKQGYFFPRKFISLSIYFLN